MKRLQPAGGGKPGAKPQLQFQFDTCLPHVPPDVVDLSRSWLTSWARMTTAPTSPAPTRPRPPPQTGSDLPPRALPPVRPYIWSGGGVADKPNAHAMRSPT